MGPFPKSRAVLTRLQGKLTRTICVSEPLFPTHIHPKCLTGLCLVGQEQGPTNWASLTRIFTGLLTRVREFQIVDEGNNSVTDIQSGLCGTLIHRK